MKISHLKNIQFETELLESLGWDDEKLYELYTYVSEAIKTDYPSAMQLLAMIEHISKNYSKETANIVKKLFIEAEKGIKKDGNSKN